MGDSDVKKNDDNSSAMTDIESISLATGKNTFYFDDNIDDISVINSVKTFLKEPNKDTLKFSDEFKEKNKCEPVTAKEGNYYHTILYGNKEKESILGFTEQFNKFSKILDKGIGSSKNNGFFEYKITLDSFITHMAVHKNCRTKRKEANKESWTFKEQRNEKNLKELLEGGVGLLKAFGQFLKTYEEENFEDELKKIQDDKGNPIDFTELIKLLKGGYGPAKDQDSDAAIMFKQLFCFASKRYDELEKKTDVQNGGYGDEVSLFNRVSPTRRRIMWIITFMAYMYFLFVAIENFRLLISGINQVLDYRAEYIANVGEDIIQDNSYGSYISGFFNVMYEGAMGTLLNTIITYQDSAINRVKHSFAVAASDTGRSTWEACNNSFFNCVNQYLTGDMTRIGQNTAVNTLTYESNRAMNDAIHEVRTQYTQLTNNFTSVSNGIVTSINGLICSTILLGHMISPKTYPAALVYSSMGSMMPIYSSGTSIYGLYLTMQNFGILLRPRQVIEAATAATIGVGVSQQGDTHADDDGHTTQTNTGSVGTSSEETNNTGSGGSPEAAPVVEAEPVSKGILGTIINLMGGKKGKTPKQKKRKNAKRSLKKMKRKSRSSR